MNLPAFPHLLNELDTFHPAVLLTKPLYMVLRAHCRVHATVGSTTPSETTTARFRENILGAFSLQIVILEVLGVLIVDSMREL